MEDYKNIQNVAILNIACIKMLKEKFNITLSDDKLEKLITEISNEVVKECETMNLNIKELNNITLSKIKKIYQNYVLNSSPSSKISETIEREKSNNNLENQILDDDYINYKLKELEIKRKIIPQTQNNLETNNISDNTLNFNGVNNNTSSNAKEVIYKTNPISITLPSTLETKKMYKNFIINSLNRDWFKNPSRNNIKCNITLDYNNNILYPYCICFPKFVKNITPYVLMNINDGSKNIFYTFTCLKSYNDSRWDLWFPIKNVENILLYNKLWSIKFYDFTNNELDLGSDCISVLEVSKNKNMFDLKINSTDNNFMKNDKINIRTYDGKIHLCKIFSYENELLTIYDEKDELTIDDFINSKILNIYNQYSFIIKYHYIEK